MLTSVWLTLTPATTPAGPTGTGVHSASEPLVVGYPTPSALMVPSPLRKLGKIGLANRSPKATRTRTMTAMTSKRVRSRNPLSPALTSGRPPSDSGLVGSEVKTSVDIYLQELEVPLLLS